MPHVTSSILVGLYLLLFLGLVQGQDFTIQPGDDPSQIVLNSETNNNTSARYQAGDPSYCTMALPNLQTSSQNQAAGAS